MVQGWKLVKEIHDAPATMTEDEMQAAMAEVAMAFGRKETL
jgi:hypothetical protein